VNIFDANARFVSKQVHWADFSSHAIHHFVPGAACSDCHFHPGEQGRFGVVVRCEAGSKLIFTSPCTMQVANVSSPLLYAYSRILRIIPFEAPAAWRGGESRRSNERLRLVVLGVLCLHMHTPMRQGAGRVGRSQRRWPLACSA